MKNERVEMKMLDEQLDICCAVKIMWKRHIYPEEKSPQSTRNGEGK